MDYFKGIENADVTRRGEDLPDGFEGIVEIVMTEASKTNNSGLRYFANFTVVESNNPAAPVGITRKWSFDLGANTANANMLGFLAACLGTDVDNKEFRAVANDAANKSAAPKAEILKGYKARVRVTQTQTKKGHTFKRHDWTKV